MVTRACASLEPDVTCLDIVGVNICLLEFVDSCLMLPQLLRQVECAQDKD